MAQVVELREIKQGETFCLRGSGARYQRGEYDAEKKGFYAREAGYLDWEMFPADALVEVAA